MISLELHKKLIKKWKKVDKNVYQKISRRYRLKYFMNYVDLFKGKDVLELGINSAIYGYEISQVANSYIGLDHAEYCIKQAKVTQEYMKNPNTKLILGNVKDFIKLDLAGKAPKYNALFASFVLYHLTKKETNRLAKYVLPKCDVVIIQTRFRIRTPARLYNPHDFNKPKNVVKYLSREGFKCKVHWSSDKKYGIIIATREKNEN